MFIDGNCFASELSAISIELFNIEVDIKKFEKFLELDNLNIPKNVVNEKIEMLKKLKQEKEYQAFIKLSEKYSKDTKVKA